MHESVAPLATVFRLNTALFHRSVEGVDPEAAESRPNERTNHLAFLACHALDARLFLLRALGEEMENPWAELFDAASGIEDMKAFPKLGEVRDVWAAAGARLLNLMDELSDPELEAESPHRFPTDDRTVLGMIAFLAFHESYHVGQMGLVRKFLGFSPVVPSRAALEEE